MPNALFNLLGERESDTQLTQLLAHLSLSESKYLGAQVVELVIDWAFRRSLEFLSVTWNLARKFLTIGPPLKST